LERFSLILVIVDNEKPATCFFQIHRALKVPLNCIRYYVSQTGGCVNGVTIAVPARLVPLFGFTGDFRALAIE
jgi:hypothetical protein